MKVLKFGGTSVGTPASLANVKRIVDALEEPGIVVVSALGGLTDGLIGTARMAAAGDDGYRAGMRMMARRHFDIINEMIPQARRGDVRQQVGEFLSQLEDIYTGVSLIRDLPDRVLNRIVSFGERMSSIMVANMLNDAGHADPLEFVKTEKKFGKDVLAADLTYSLISQRFALPLERTVVTGGFISRDRRTGEITNLGRGGSDFTAALIAAALNAEVLEIWTDVDGFMTADPRVVGDARVIDRMSFAESMALCNFGAKVIYPPTILPVFSKGIPIKVLNTHHPQAPGTIIDDSCCKERAGVCGVSSVKDAAILTFVSDDFTDDWLPRIERSLEAFGVGVITLAWSQVNGGLAVVVAPQDIDLSVDALQMEFAPEIQSGKIREIAVAPHIAVVAAVGADGDALNVLADNIVLNLKEKGVELLATTIDENCSGVVVMIDAASVETVLKTVHSVCFPA